MMYQTYDKLREQYPTHRFVFLTLTIKNPKITDLRETLQHMNKSWHRLVKRKEFMTAVEVGYVQPRSHAPKTPKTKTRKTKEFVLSLAIPMHTLTFMCS